VNTAGWALRALSL